MSATLPIVVEGLLYVKTKNQCREEKQHISKTYIKQYHADNQGCASTGHENYSDVFVATKSEKFWDTFEYLYNKHQTPRFKKNKKNQLKSFFSFWR